MATIPQVLIEKHPPIPGLRLLGRGKVRDNYQLGRQALIPYTTDRISIFDFVLPAEVRQKGEVLNALSVFWTQKKQEICPTDLLCWGKDTDKELPGSLQDNPVIQKRATVVRLLKPTRYEHIVRLHITGSAWTSYEKDGTVFGERMPKGLQNGDRLPYPLYTPTTKSETGHDLPVSPEEVNGKLGPQPERMALRLALYAAEYARTRGIILADTKFEFGYEDDRSGNLILIDEKLTPDSSRYWGLAEWHKANAFGKLPPSRDKQFVREWGKSVGIDKLDPENPEHVAKVHSLRVPEKVLEDTSQLYRYIFWRLTGTTLERYQRTLMGIDLSIPVRKVSVVVGSESDVPQLTAGLKRLGTDADYRVDILSCHRNFDELIAHTERSLSKADVIIACAGMAAHLPGWIKSKLCALGRPDLPVIGVALKGKTEEDDIAALTSISRLPGYPVEMKEDGKPYFGPEGFKEACEAAINAEFLPRNIEHKPAHINYMCRLT